MKRLLYAALALLTLLGLGLAAFHVGLQQFQSRLLDSLGPRASVEDIRVGWRGLEIRGLRVRGDPQGAPAWPAADEFRAQRVWVRPELSQLWSRQADGSRSWRIARVEVEAPYVSLLRTRDGRLKVVPGLLERPPKGPAAQSDSAEPPLKWVVEQLVLRDAEVEFFDASVRQPAHKMRLQALAMQAGPLHGPEMNQPIQLMMDAVFKGVQRDGRLQIKGRVTPSSQDAQIEARVDDVDLLALQPYLLRVNEGGVRSGHLSLRLQASVQAKRLRAPGTLTLSQISLAPASGLRGTFAGVSRQAVLDAMATKGKIELKFVLDGRLDDPNFSLNENVLNRLGGGLAETLGVSLGGVVEGVGGVIKGLLGR